MEEINNLEELISIIVPAHNAEKYLEECVYSIINQTYKNIELLIIDDGSTDRTFELCNSIKDPRIILFKNETSMGVSFCRQFGIEHAHGVFFMTIDADDYILQDCISELYHSLKEYKSDIAICDRYDFINNKKEIKKRIQKNGFLAITPEILSNSFKEIGFKCGLSDSWDKMYRLQFVIDSNVKFDLPNGLNGNDLLFNYRLAIHCPKYSFVNKPFLMHRLTKQSISRSANRPITKSFQIITSRIVDEVKKLSIPNNVYFEISKILMSFRYVAFVYYCNQSKKLLSDIKISHKSFDDYTKSHAYLKVLHFETNDPFFKAFIKYTISNNVRQLYFLGIRFKIINRIEKLIGKIH